MKPLCNNLFNIVKFIFYVSFVKWRDLSMLTISKYNFQNNRKKHKENVFTVTFDIRIRWNSYFKMHAFKAVINLLVKAFGKIGTSHFYQTPIFC